MLRMTNEGGEWWAKWTCPSGGTHMHSAECPLEAAAAAYRMERLRVISLHHNRPDVYAAVYTKRQSQPAKPNREQQPTLFQEIHR